MLFYPCLWPHCLFNSTHVSIPVSIPFSVPVFFHVSGSFIISSSTWPPLYRSWAQPLCVLSTSCLSHPSAPHVTTSVRPWLLVSPNPSHLWLCLSLAPYVCPWLRLSVIGSLYPHMTDLHPCPCNITCAHVYDTEEKETAIRFFSHIFSQWQIKQLVPHLVCFSTAG